MLLRRLLLLAGVLAVAAAIGAALAVRELGRRLDASHRGYAVPEVFVDIEAGDATRAIGRRLAAAGVVTAADLANRADGERVLVGGVVTHRQRPATAGGVTFLSLEDETGLINVVVSRGCWQHHRKVATGAPALLVRGRLESSEGVLNVVAERLEALPVARAPASRDFR